TDYVLQDILGRSQYVLPWEDKLCPGNPTDDPESGASEYNRHALERAHNDGIALGGDPIGDAVSAALKSPGEAYRALARDLAAAYLGDYQFLISDLEQWDEETKPIRAGLVFSNQDLRSLSARQVMALRARTAQA
ncbi:hypothetical protein, partial [Pseudomonas sp. URMO17WK12:I11]|uniref:hypothetical protein n=2 Tax=Pseudomonas sp. URMO17WK12:I11 TaxID=1283291 RepID=UPI00119DA304